jgi:hypothetical protein
MEAGACKGTVVVLPLTEMLSPWLRRRIVIFMLLVKSGTSFEGLLVTRAVVASVAVV